MSSESTAGKLDVRFPVESVHQRWEAGEFVANGHTGGTPYLTAGLRGWHCTGGREQLRTTSATARKEMGASVLHPLSEQGNGSAQS